MFSWIGGLPYQYLGEDRPIRKLITLNRLKLFAIVNGFIVTVVLLGISITYVIMLKVGQQNSDLRTQTTKYAIPRPTPPAHNTSTNKSKICQLPNKIPVYNQTGEIISGSLESHQLKSPSDIFVDNKGNLYVADTGNKRILKYTKNTNIIMTVVQGTDAYSELNSPVSLYVDEYDTIYILDNQYNLDSPAALAYYRIFIYWPKLQKGIYEYEGILLLNGSTGKGFGLYLDSELNIYVATSNDPDSDQFSPGTYGTGSIIKWLSPTYEYSTYLKGKTTNRFSDNINNGLTPKNIYIDKNNNLYFTDWSIFAVIGLRMTSYDIIKSSENTSTTLSFSSSPAAMDITTDCNDNMYIADGTDDTIKFYRLTDSYIKKDSIIVDIKNAYNQSADNGLTFIALDSQNGDIYTVNQMHSYIRKFTVQNYIDTSTDPTKYVNVRNTTTPNEHYTTPASFFDRMIDKLKHVGINI